METTTLTTDNPMHYVARRFADQHGGSLSERLYGALRQSILVGDLPSGLRIFETELASLVAVSRTPLREALRRLEAEGLVVAEPNRGVVVRGVAIEELLEVYQILAVLEAFAVELAAVNINEAELGHLRDILDLIDFYAARERWDESITQGVQFHQVLYTASRNAQLGHLIESLRERVHSFRRSSLRARPIVNQAYSAHREIVDALAARDGARASRIMREHINEAIVLLQQGTALRDEQDKEVHSIQ